MAYAQRQAVQVGHNGGIAAAPYTAAQKPARSSAATVASSKERFPNCQHIDGFCPDAHPLMFEDPVPSFFTCKTDADCNDHRCVSGKCQCAGGNLFHNCGAMVMFHREWEHLKRTRPHLAQGQRTVPHPMTYLLKGDYLTIADGKLSHPDLHVAPDATINIPSDEFFLQMTRQDNIMQRLYVRQGWQCSQGLLAGVPPRQLFE